MAKMHTRWTVAIRYEDPFEMVSAFPAEAMGVTVDGKPVEFAAPTCFVVVDGKNFGSEAGRFDTPEEAQEAANEMNRKAAQGPLDPEFIERRDRLKKLAPNFRSYFYEGPPEARWPVRPARYLLHDYGVGWHPEDSYELVDDLEGARTAIAGDEANVGSVIDLDTGEEVSFERQVVVSFADA